MTDPAPPVFVSYASSDRARAVDLARALEHVGVAAWIDVAGIGGGQNYGPEIVAGIRGCDALLLLCSEASLASRNVRQEVALAWRFGRPILPLRLETVEFSDDLIYWLEGAQWIDILDHPRDTWFPSLARALGRIGILPGCGPMGEAPHAGDSGRTLPIPPTSILGRARELDNIRHRLRAGARLLTLTGPGGSGKTRLALEAARDEAENFPHGVVFVDLAPVRDPALVLPSIAEALGVRESPDRPLLEELQVYLQPRRLLLVLDNVEQVIEAAGDIADLLATAPGLVILATSRAPLRVRAEVEIAVAPLAVPPSGASIGARASPAVALFVERAQAAGADVQLSGSNLAAVAEIVRRLDGLPLAIELAAAQAKLFPPEAMLVRFERRLPMPADGPRDLPARHRTLAATIAWSYDLLAPGEQILFRRLAVFVGGCTFAAAEAVSGDVDPYVGLAALVHQSLLRQERAEGEPRFVMLETIREFATARLTESGEDAEIRWRHAQQTLAQVEADEPLMKGPDQAAASARLDADHDNVRSALDWALEHDTDAALRLAASMFPFWFVRSHWTEGRAWLDRALALPRTKAASPDELPKVLTGAAMLARAQGDLPRAAALADEALPLARAGGNGRLLARALYTRGAIAMFQGDYDLAAGVLEEGLELAREEGPSTLVASILNVLSDVADARGDDARAIELLEEAVALKREAGDADGLAVCLSNLGAVMLDHGQPARAVPFLDEALVLFRDLKDRANTGMALHNLGIAALDSGESARAAEFLPDALAISAEVGDQSGIALGLLAVGRLALAQRRSVLALRLFAAADAAREAIGEQMRARELAEYEEQVAHARAALPPAVADEAWRIGRTLTVEAATTEAHSFAGTLAER